MWKKPEGAEKQGKIAAEFWQPKDRGEVLTGFLKSIPDGSFGSYLYFSPAVIYPVDGPPQGYGSLSVGLNSWLKKLVTDEHVSSYMAVAFQGNDQTPQGKMRTFSVYLIPLSEWTQEVERDVPGFLADTSSGASRQQQEDRDDLPF